MSEFINGWWSAPDEYIGPSTGGASNEQIKNANRMYKFFIGQGWTRKSIAAMIGNIQVESTLNPGLWQGRTAPVLPETPYTTEKGFGLTQWTPANKLITWADEFALDYTHGDTQTGRIQYEMLNELQWGDDVDITFWNFAHDDTQTLERLVLAWLWDYERPATPDIPARQANAVYWFNKMGKPPIWLLFQMSKRRK